MSSATAEAAGARGDGADRVTGAAAPVPTPAAWTRELKAEARRMFDAGMTYKAIGDALGFRKNQVIGLGNRDNWPKRPCAGASDLERARIARWAGHVKVEKPRVARPPKAPKPTKPRAAVKRRARGPKPPAPAPKPVVRFVASRPSGPCHWPTTDGVGFRFECTSPAVAGACSPYCAEHLARSWAPLPKRRAA